MKTALSIESVHLSISHERNFADGHARPRRHRDP
jgi:hypothetical protein